MNGGGGGALHLRANSSSWTDLSTIPESRSQGSRGSSRGASVLGSSARGSRGCSRGCSSPGVKLLQGEGAPRASPFAAPAAQAGGGKGGVVLDVGLEPIVPGPQRGKVVSLLAKGLKSMGQKQTWANMLPGITTVKRTGMPRSWSFSRKDSSVDGSSHRGRRVAPE